METFLYVMLAIMVAFQIGIILWVAKKNAESDAKYERDLDEIYSRRKK